MRSTVPAECLLRDLFLVDADGCHDLPLYAYVLSNREGIAEVEAECLKLLAKVPASVVDGLFVYYNSPVPAGGGFVSAIL